ncbi:TIR domain-containing protein [Indioceanicola profundi]|uniref:TIR domain-containing protein n=1 Tax=Indioceanicola profundi TaxID=2220096 RepID=UPI000E6AD3B0|nr:TIR domain-containing protein [Indioceanicola profundi]
MSRLLGMGILAALGYVFKDDIAMFFNAPTTMRWVYFSFHFDRDVMRLHQVKNHWVTKPNRKEAGYFDGSLEELAKKEGSVAVKRAINKGLAGSSVTCVLIGTETYERRWVQYEVFKSIEKGNGIFGVRVHDLKDPRTRSTDPEGPNIFDYLGYGWSERSAKLVPNVLENGKWAVYDDADPIPASSATYLTAGTTPTLSDLFPVYDWVQDDGYNNFATWVDAAARHAGR